MEEKTFKIISFCSIPKHLTEKELSEVQTDSYVPFKVYKNIPGLPFSELNTWIGDQYPELYGQEILIHVDY